MTFFIRQIQEIQKSRSLQWYGFFLAITHTLSAYFWSERGYYLMTKSEGPSLCWPFFSHCEILRFSTESHAQLGLALYFIVSLAIALTFILQKIPLAYWGLLGLWLLKSVLTLTSYGLMGNYHYMAFVVQFFFIFLPFKKTYIPFVIGAFYWGAGLLKINPEWLSGEALVAPSFLPGSLQHLSLIYVVILESILVFLLFSKNTWVRNFTLLQFVFFHIFSWHIVGYFYPLIMLSLLSIFVLSAKSKTYSATWDQIFHSKISLTALAMLLLAQLTPYIFSVDPAKSGVPRLLAVNMMDAKIQCQTVLIIQGEKSTSILDPFMRTSAIRTQCDPVLFFAQLSQICQGSTEPMDFVLSSRRTTEDKFVSVLNVKNVCKNLSVIKAEL